MRFASSRGAFLTQELVALDIPKRRGIDAMAAALLGTAGLLEDFGQMRLQPSDPETGAYLEDLFRHWRRVREQFEGRRMTGFCWYPSSTRPANFPARRLTAIAAFLHYHGPALKSLLMQPLQHADISLAGIAFGVSPVAGSFRQAASHLLVLPFSV